MKLTKYIIISLITTSLLMGCDNDFEEINANVDDPVIVPSSMIIGTVVRNMANELYSTFNGSEHGETWIQHISLIQYNDPERYIPRTTTMDRLWNTPYMAASNALQMQNIAAEEGNEVNQGVALVLQAYCFHILTDLYGDVPYSEALKGPGEGNFAPAYDTQEQVYDGILSLIDQAIPLLGGSGTIDSNMDILYHGDAGKWLKFAYSLKFRCLMRISSKRDVSSDLQELVNDGSLFGSNDDEAKLVYLSASPEANPIFENIVDQGRNEYKLAETLINKLKELNDPRLPVYAEPAVNSGDYVGKPTGYEESPLPGYGYDDVSSIGAKYLEPTAPGYFFSYTELLFMLAEAAKKGYISGGDDQAQMYYEAAIRNSLEENGVGSAFDDYLAGAVIYSPSRALEQIGVQKWISLFCQGFESWTEWRRTGYPVLQPAVDGRFNEIPSRLRYESNEASVNNIYYEEVVSRIGGDELTTKVWWMQ